jgi:lipopolysaccharide export system protein LptA
VTRLAAWAAACCLGTRAWAQAVAEPATPDNLPVAAAPRESPPPATTNSLRGTTITSERIEFDYKEFVAVFDENVKVDNPQFFLTADRVVIFLEGTNQVRQIMALGHVTLTNDQRVASCDKAVYTRLSGQVVMTGNAMLRRAGDHVSGDRIVIWLDDERMEVSPGHFVIAPETLRQRQKQANTNAPAQP